MLAPQLVLQAQLVLHLPAKETTVRHRLHWMVLSMVSLQHTSTEAMHVQLDLIKQRQDMKLVCCSVNNFGQHAFSALQFAASNSVHHSFCIVPVLY